MTSPAPKPVILLAEDDEDIVALVQDALEPLQCSIRTARDGLAALEIARQAACSLAILDVRMPSLDGLELARRLRADPATRSLPMLIVTASAGHDDERIREAAVDAVLAKPFELAELRATVRELLERDGG